MTTPKKLIYASVLVFSLQAVSKASSLLVSYSSTTGGGGIEMFSLTPQSAGTMFDTENAPVTSITTANNSAYWVSNSQVFTDSLTDITGGGGKTPLPSIPFAGVTISDLAVDPLTNSYLLGWVAPGRGWFVAQYPLTPSNNFTVFANSTTTVQGLTIVGNTAYWFEGTNVLSQNLNGSGKTLVQSFPFGNVSLNDLAVGAATQSYLLAASTPGLPPLLAQYPLTPNSTGILFAFANNNIAAVTVAGNRAYWIDGSNIWSENLNGTGLTLQETLPSQFTLTDLAVSLDAPAGVPEPASSAMIGGGLISLGMVRRRRGRGKRRAT